MKKTQWISILTLGIILLGFSGCKDDEVAVVNEGKVDLVFSHFIGNVGLRLFETIDDNFQYGTRTGQLFNVNKFGYYISNIVISGPNGAYYEEEVKITASNAQGVYLVDHSNESSRLITLTNIPEGEYDRVSFTMGIDAAKVTEGQQGGILDPNNGAWYRNWEAGYMLLRFEGRSPSSPQIATSKYPKHGMHTHITGWKDVADNPMLVNNVKRFEFRLPQTLKMGKDWLPNVHFSFDILQMLESQEQPIDFSVTYDIHHPIDGKPFADRLEDAMVLDHVHQ